MSAPAPPEHEAVSRTPWWLLLIQLAIATVIMAIVASYAGDLLEGTERKRRQHRPERNATMVEVALVQSSSERILVHASGTVMPSHELDIHARAQGEVITLGDFEPGRVVKQGDTLVKLDTKDARLLLKQTRATLQRTRAEMRLEEGQQAISKAEYKHIKSKLGKEHDAALLLREPQLEIAQIAVTLAELTQDTVELDISRAHVKAPFDALVISRSVTHGSRVTEATPLAHVVATDVWWIEIAVPLDQLALLDIPEAHENRRGSTVKIFHRAAWGDDVFRKGHVLRLAAGLEAQGRMARVLVAVEQPLAPNLPKLHLDAWVEVEMEGLTLDDVIPLERRLVHEGQFAWVMTAENTLDIRALDIAFHGRDKLLVRGGLASGERVVTTHLGSPVQGMALRLPGKPGEPSKDEKEKHPEGGRRGKNSQARGPSDAGKQP